MSEGAAMRRTDMDKAKEVLRLHHELNLSQRDISAATGCSLGTVSTVLKKANEAGIAYPIQVTSKELGSLLYPTASPTVDERPEPNLKNIHKEMQRKGVTLTLLWEEYKTEHPDGLMFTQFCKRYRQFRKQNDVYMRKIYKAGDQMMVDWAGLTMEYRDSEGFMQKAYLFVAVLPATSYIYAEPFRDMQLNSWIRGHVNALEVYGGTPRIVVPDNTKTAVIKANYYDPKLNKTYREFASHYGLAIIPARPRKPKDKAPAENAVKNVENRVIAKLRNRAFLSFDELCEAVDEEVNHLNTRPFQKMPSNREQTFLELEKEALKPLPDTRYEYAEWHTAKTAFDYHVQYQKHYYSVPYMYAGKHVEIRATLNTIEIFFNHERIAVHIREYTKRKRDITNTDHMPDNHKEIAEWTPERFISWGKKYGQAVAEYMKYLMDNRDCPEQAFKTCRGILSLIEKLESDVIDRVCVLAMEKQIYSYKYFNMLIRNAASEKPKIITHENVRGQSYYGGH